MVGCVIVKNNKVIGRGFHQRAGAPHAEVIALEEAGADARNATVYVTLEPCCHYGRTPPCSEALIAAGVKEVYAACQDPNPIIAGKGVAALKAAGIHVYMGEMAAQARALNEVFFHYITQRKPFVIAKWAMSLDGKTCVNADDTPQISGEAAWRQTHQLRQQVDAILVGANTVEKDNPQLTARLTPQAKQPVRIILSGKKPLSEHLHIFEKSQSRTIIAATKRASKFYQGNNRIEVMTISEDQYGKVNLHELLDKLAQEKITSLLVEGGRTVHESFIRENLINKFQIYLAPTLIGATSKKIPVEVGNFYQLGKDFYFDARLKEDSHV